MNPGELAQVNVELDPGTRVDDGREVSYSVTDPSKAAFQIQLRVKGHVATSQVHFEGIGTSVSPIGSTVSIGFTGGIATPCILSGNESYFQTNKLPIDWMQSNLSDRGSLLLK
ncbi:MAG: hypothetical protein M1829_001354 [Trizodia sp. TS-e1964]|nr:MAG: hypothetical protein M1829_001354 [Trizodia sp. TS-e1964]